MLSPVSLPRDGGALCPFSSLHAPDPRPGASKGVCFCLRAGRSLAHVPASHSASRCWMEASLLAPLVDFLNVLVWASPGQCPDLLPNLLIS